MSKIDWEKVVSDSHGTSVFLPEKFRAAAEEVEKLRKEFNTEVEKMAKKEITMNVATQKMFYELRLFLEENGRPDIWRKDLGFNVTALDDGKFIVNLTEPTGR